MYRYLLFAHRHYEAAGGMSDLVFKFDTVDELQKELTNGGVDIGLKYQDGFEIYDIKYDKTYWYEIDCDDGIDGVFDEFIADNLK